MHIPGFVAAMLLLVAIFGRAVFMIPLENTIGLMVAGAINVVGQALSYKALQAGDTADVSIFSQAAPVMSLVLSLFILGESITLLQLLGFAFIIAAAAVVIFGHGQKRRQAPTRNFIILTFASLFFSVLSDVIFAYFLRGFTADFTLFAQSFYFFEAGSLVFTILVLIFILPWRRAVVKTFFTGPHHKRNLVLSFTDNLMLLLGEILYKLGLIIAPVIALVAVVQKISKLFASLFVTIFLGRAFPKFVHGRRLTRQLLLRYVFSGILAVTGIMLVG
ncbi:EamA family transporter [Candidatus Saccharibacteria bacterium]|nr:EamA family transporter [Candidatus Saccharibacteria bacterium]